MTLVKYSVNGLKNRLAHSVWTFPILLTVILLGLTAFRISGTSVGIYHQFLYGNSDKDPGLLFGSPRSIRSDEWLVTTQMTVVQSVNNFPRFNDDFGRGRDMSVIADVPYREWSIIFKPQNLVFFLLPLEYAFAFKWWLLLYLLVIACYLFVLKLFPKRHILAALLSLGIGFSPFVFWWYQTITIAPLFYGFFTLLLLMRLIDQERLPLLKKQWHCNLAYGALLAYLMASFALVMYPPFQIPIVIVMGIFIAGYILEKRFNSNISFKALLKRLTPAIGALLVAVIIVGIFIFSRYDAIHKINNTIYPGNRIVSSGGLNPLNVFNSFLLPQLQSSSKAEHFFNNQSEASNFILLSPFLLIPGFVLLIHTYRKYRRIDWLLISLQLGVLLFLARVFIPAGDLFYKLLLLHKVPNERLIIGLGFIGILQMLVFTKRLADQKIRSYWQAASIYALACFGILLLIGWHVHRTYPLFTFHPLVTVSLAAMFSSLILLVLVNRPVLVASAFVVFSLISVVRIHPLYQGLGILTNSSSVIQKIKLISSPADTWVAADNILFENFGLLSDRDSLSGVSFYPDVDFWRQLDVTQAEAVTNRYAHIVFSSNPGQKEKLQLVQSDFFLVKLECSNFVRKEIDFVLSTQKFDLDCAKPQGTVEFPRQTFYFYAID